MGNPLHRNRVVCVLGMHRSGTSLLTGCLSLLGITLGNPQNLLPPAPNNPTGFWEHARIYSLQEQLLNTLDRNWTSPTPMPSGWTQTPAAGVFKAAMVRLCAEEFRGRSIWAFKDPRTCRLLPLWKEIFAELNSAPNFLLVVRNPLEVADSLARRDGLSRSRALALWLCHNLDVVEHTQDAPLVVVNHGFFLGNWQNELERVRRRLSLPEPRDRRVVDAELSAFIKPELRHHDRPETNQVPKAVAETYRLLSEAARDRPEALPMLLRRLTVRKYSVNPFQMQPG